MPYRLSSRAERDLDEVWLYVAEDASPTTADRLIDEIVDRFDLLADTVHVISPDAVGFLGRCCWSFFI